MDGTIISQHLVCQTVDSIAISFATGSKFIIHITRIVVNSWSAGSASHNIDAGSESWRDCWAKGSKL